MLYYIIRPVAKIALASYFKKIYLTNIENVPLDKPVILACNHPTAFVEPCIMACWLPKPLNFLARGDFFLLPIVPYFLRAVNIIPIFRMRDGGYQKLKNNYESFKACYQAFSENKLVLIMAEGGTVHEKRLRPIKKGAARLAFGALENDAKLDLKIVPVAVNYTKSEDFRRRAMIDFGVPISVQDFWSDYQKNNAKGIKILTEKLEDALSEKVIHIADENQEEVINFLLTLEESRHQENLFPAVENKDELLKKQLRITKGIDKLNENEKGLFYNELNNLYEEFKSLNINELYFFTKPIKKMRFFASFLIFGLGVLLNFIPLLLAQTLAKKFFPTDLTFQTSMKIFFVIPLYLLWLVSTGVLLHFFDIGLPAWSIIFIPILGKSALHFYDFFDKWVAQKRLEKISKEKKIKWKKKWENLRKIWA